MTILVILALGFILYNISPTLANVAAWLITLGFIVPVLTFSFGSLSWVVYNCVSPSHGWTADSWVRCCAFLGLPFSSIFAWHILSD